MLGPQIDDVAATICFYWNQFFWELLDMKVFFLPNNFWQGPKTIFLTPYILVTLGDDLIEH